MARDKDRKTTQMHLNAIVAGRNGHDPCHPALRTLLEAAEFNSGIHYPDVHGADGAFRARYRFEHAWLRSLPGLSPFAAAALAARVAASQPATGQQGRPVLQANAFLLDTPDLDALLPALQTLGVYPSDERPGEADLGCLARAWPFALAVEALLASGGDDRLALDTATGANRYGCAPWPQPEVIGFASCTASSPAAKPFVAAERARRRLIEFACADGPDAALAEASSAASDRILTHFGVADLAEAVLTASGTDAALIVTGLLAAEHPASPITSLLVSPAETGSGVPQAVQGQHFAGYAPSGRPVAKGSVLDGLLHTPSLVTIALRDAAGAPVRPSDVAQACEAAIQAALPRGRVVLHAIDGSKTGLAAPDRSTLLRLAQRFGASLDIVIDACQARIEPALIRWYLTQGFPVLVTGSKFFAAPGFCGAILFPRHRLRHIAAGGRLACGLASYARLDGGVGSRHCAGLVLRWTAGLHEMDAFGRLAIADVAQRLDRLGLSIRTTLLQDSRLRLIDAPRPDGMGWSDRRSVFTFAVRGQDGWMDAAALRCLYLTLADNVSGTVSGRADPATAALRCRIGQPVQLGSPDVGALRLALSAAQVSQDADLTDQLASVVNKLRLLLDAEAIPRTAASAGPALVAASYG